MKQIILVITSITLLSCSQKETDNTRIIAVETKRIESINVERKKLNDSITIRNQQNIWKDLSGKHKVQYSSSETSDFFGTVNFEKTGRDLYTMTGSAQSGKNTLNINGTIKRVSEKHLNFDGEISQKINGTFFKRTKKTTFFDEGKGKFWRLQNKINGSGFVEYIDIYF